MQNVSMSAARYGLAMVLIIALALVASTAMSPGVLGGWASLLLVAMVPSQMVIGLLWRTDYPRTVADLRQPWRGLAHLLMTLASAAVVATVALWQLGGGATPPTPFVVMYLILSVPVTLTLIVVFQAWPLTRVFRNPGLIGVAVLLAAYGITWLLFVTLFDFSFARQAPFYDRVLDPQGTFMAWYPLTASLAGLVFMLVLVLLDFWPIEWLSRLHPAWGRQPGSGLAAALLVAACSAASLWLGLAVCGLDVVVFMTRMCVATIFGIFIVLVMLEGLPALRWPQPWRGWALASIALMAGQAMYLLYRAVARHSFDLAGGQPPYELDLWLASSMLSVTFPAMVLFAQYFQFWPLRRQVDTPPLARRLQPGS